jgi:DNA-binding response OmpR family regulator
MKLLLIEDDPDLRQSVADYFRRAGSECIAAGSVGLGLDPLLDACYDCILLDTGLPNGRGIDLLHEIRDRERNEGIIILSARSAPEDKIRGLELGADDYITKPFYLPEVRARVQSVIRRKQFNGGGILRFNELRVEFGNRRFYVHDRAIDLSRKEHTLLLFLVTNQRRVVSKTAIAEYLAGGRAGYQGNDDLVYAHVKNLKRKLSAAGCRDYIKTVHGLGYRFDIHENA